MGAVFSVKIEKKLSTMFFAGSEFVHGKPLNLTRVVVVRLIHNFLSLCLTCIRYCLFCSSSKNLLITFFKETSENQSKGFVNVRLMSKRFKISLTWNNAKWVGFNLIGKVHL